MDIPFKSSYENGMLFYYKISQKFLPNVSEWKNYIISDCLTEEVLSYEVKPPEKSDETNKEQIEGGTETEGHVEQNVVYSNATDNNDPDKTDEIPEPKSKIILIQFSVITKVYKKYTKLEVPIHKFDNLKMYMIEKDV